MCTSARCYLSDYFEPTKALIAPSYYGLTNSIGQAGIHDALRDSVDDVRSLISRVFSHYLFLTTYGNYLFCFPFALVRSNTSFISSAVFKLVLVLEFVLCDCS